MQFSRRCRMVFIAAAVIILLSLNGSNYHRERLGTDGIWNAADNTNNMSGHLIQQDCPIDVHKRINCVLSCLSKSGDWSLRPQPGQVFACPPMAAWRDYVTKIHAHLSPARGLPMHGYKGFAGPWIENHAIEALEPHLFAFYPFVPLLAQWTDRLASESSALNQQARDAATGAFTLLDPSLVHFAVTQHDRGDVGCLADLSGYRNVLLFSGGGWGDVPIPLLKSPVGPHQRKTARKYVFSFVGNLVRTRSRILLAFSSIIPEERRLFVSAQTDSWQDQFASESFFCLAPRGYGRTSFRLAELIQSGCVPIYVSNDVLWVPYFDTIGNVTARHAGELGEGGTWGPAGIGFAVTDKSAFKLVCVLCLFITPGSSVIPLAKGKAFLAHMQQNEDAFDCPCDANAWSATINSLSTADGSLFTSPDSALAAMENRIKQIAQTHFSYAGALEQVSTFLNSPCSGQSDLRCAGKPGQIGTMLGSGESVREPCP